MELNPRQLDPEVPAVEMPETYQPTEEQSERIAAVKAKYDRMRNERQAQERQWFLNAAFLRAQQYVDWSVRTSTVEIPDAPSHRIRLVANRILPKIRARRAKFVKNRPTWYVVPASPDQEDKMNARATQKALDYQWRRLKLELAHIEAILWAEVTGRGYWWMYWDPAVQARVKTPMGITNVTVGDCGIEVSGPFEVLVSDTTRIKIADQPEIMRIKMRDLAEMKARFPDFANYFTPTGDDPEPFTYEKKIAGLNSAGVGGWAASSRSSEKGGKAERVLVMELFQRPSPDMPEGRYSLVVGDVLVEDRDSLPYGFSDMQNPYPVVEFVDMPIAGQYWGTTLVEQLIGIQREYNMIRSKVSEQMRLQLHPKILVAAQHQMSDTAYTSEAGEILEYVARPGIPPPQILAAPNIAQDAWKGIELIQREFDDISQIFPAAEGRAGTANSGFQTNLLQEAAESVHLPDIRLHELAIEEAAYKMRRLMKLGYEIPRLVTAIGHDYEPDVFEFSKNAIDEDADIVVEAGSALPSTKWGKIDAVMKMYEKGVLGDPADPDVKRRTMNMMELGTTEDAYDFARRDIDKARIENTMMSNGTPPKPPAFYDNHQIHYQIHCDEMKATEGMTESPQIAQGRLVHVIQHAEFINPSSALKLAGELGLTKVLKPSTLALQAQMMQPPAPGSPPQGVRPAPTPGPSPAPPMR